MSLDEIYKPISDELDQVDRLLDISLKSGSNKTIEGINRYVLESPGKRIRPALVILSAKTVSRRAKGEALAKRGRQLIKIASAVELIHMASLIHDDVLDHASLRHNKPSVNYKWGNEVSIALGDYLYSKAFELIATCKNTEVLTCLSQAVAQMCEGELTQVKERDSLQLKKRQYLVIVKRKTASLMASCCRAGAALVGGRFVYKQALTDYGLNFGIAFQVMDDYLDLTATSEELGKPAGLDITMGELTLPLLILPESKRKKLLQMNKTAKNRIGLIKEALTKSGALVRTRKFIDSYISRAKESLCPCRDSKYKKSLEDLADFINPHSCA